MKRKSSDAAPGDNRVPRPVTSHKGSNCCHAATELSDNFTAHTIDLIIILAVLFLSAMLTAGVVVLFMGPKPLTNTPKHKTTGPVPEQVREEFGTKRQSQDSEDHEHDGSVPSRNTPTDSVEDDRWKELKLSLDGLGTLMLQLTDRVVAAESVSPNGAPTDKGSQLGEVNVRLDRIESLLSQLSDEIVHSERTKASASGGSPTQKDSAAESAQTFSMPNVLVLFLCGIFAILAYLAERRRQAWADEPRLRKQRKRRHLVEAVAERLPVESRVASPSQGSEDLGLEDEDAASFENFELPADDTAN